MAMVLEWKGFPRATETRQSVRIVRQLNREVETSKTGWRARVVGNLAWRRERDSHKVSLNLLCSRPRRGADELQMNTAVIETTRGRFPVDPEYVNTCVRTSEASGEDSLGGCRKN